MSPPHYYWPKKSNRLRAKYQTIAVYTTYDNFLPFLHEPGKKEIVKSVRFLRVAARRNG